MKDKNLWVWLGGAAAAYMFLVTRTPQYTLLPTGVYAPNGMLDTLTVALTGALPPSPVAPMPTATTSVAITPSGAVSMSYTN